MRRSGRIPPAQNVPARPQSEHLAPPPNEPEPGPTDDIPQQRNEPEAEIRPQPNEPEPVPTAETKELRNEPPAPSGDSAQPNEPEIPEDCYPHFTFDASGKTIGKTYVHKDKAPDPGGVIP
jgi:hypothetical protein